MVGVVIGIDPGKQGAICTLKGKKILLLEKCPLVGSGRKRDYDPYEMSKMIKQFIDMDPRVYIEKVGPMPKQGVVSMFNFGRGVGLWYGICAALKVPLYPITPQEWKKVVLKGTDKSKAAAILRTKQMFPDILLKKGRQVRDDDNLAEATLISFYGGIKEWG